QDWVWGVSLMIAGLFFALAVTAHGVRQFRESELNHADSKMHIGRWWDFVIAVLVPLQAVVLLVWWMIDAWDSEGWWRPFAVDNVGTVLFQVGLAFLILGVANRWIARRSAPDEGTSN
ncbi:MAG: sodium-dependent transporter, partial [Planctomycetota bacterium]|nr:sodium-dependent transporter [Planctomycetota bacterium]